MRALRWAPVGRRETGRIGARRKTLLAVAGGLVAMLAAVTAGDGGRVGTGHPRGPGLAADPALGRVNVDGTLPQAATPTDLPLPADALPAADELHGGFLGIPGTALKAYRNAAAIMAGEQPDCHLDWALIAGIGRVESNHARGGYVDRNGKALEPILGPELNGAGAVAAVPDTDHGVYDLDTVWDRAVGPTQFIPSSWRLYASDGNGDGVFDPDNIYDSTLATGRHLCSGGLDLSEPGQVAAAVFRYNNSVAYVNTVILWAEAYRLGVLPLPDSRVPIGAPTKPALPAPPPVPVPLPVPPPVTIPATPPAAGPPPAGPPPAAGSPPAAGLPPVTTPASPPAVGPPQSPATSGTGTSETGTTGGAPSSPSGTPGPPGSPGTPSPPNFPCPPAASSPSGTPSLPGTPGPSGTPGTPGTPSPSSPPDTTTPTCPGPSTAPPSRTTESPAPTPSACPSATNITTTGPPVSKTS